MQSFLRLTAARRIPLAALSLAVSLAASACQRPPAQRVDQDDLVFFAPLPVRMDRGGSPPNAKLVELGRMLFYEPRLSKAGDISCNTCHPLDNFGADGERTSQGHAGVRGLRNTPTVYNAGHHIVQFWDGRAETLEDQAAGPILSREEMAMGREADVAERLGAITGYVTMFREAFGLPDAPPETLITLRRVGQALGAFERGLTTPGRFDAYLRGNTEALTARERQGLKTFTDLGCAICHNGAALGGQSMQPIGLVIPYEEDSDGGRFGVTHEPQDRRVFRVPSLRNVAETAPYFHHGGYDTLGQAVTAMAKHQLGRKLTEVQLELLVEFLQSLTGELPRDYIAKPALPH